MVHTHENYSLIKLRVMINHMMHESQTGSRLTGAFTCQEQIQCIDIR